MTTQAPPHPAATYPTDPELPQCDLVMKGGITSGLVYPPAVLQLATKYRFRGIGGASAGAIGAAAAAAAEYGREKGGFTLLEALQRDLATPGFMLDLFPASEGTRPLFEVVMSLKPVFDASGAAKGAAESARSAAVVVDHTKAVVEGLTCAIAQAEKDGEAAFVEAFTDARTRARPRVEVAKAAQLEAANQAKTAAAAAARAFASADVAAAGAAAGAAAQAAAAASLVSAAAHAAHNDVTQLAAAAGLDLPSLPEETAPAAPSRSVLSWCRRVDRSFGQTFRAAHRGGRLAGLVAGGLVVGLVALVAPHLFVGGAGGYVALAAAALFVLGSAWVGGFAVGVTRVVRAGSFLLHKENSFFGFCFGSAGTKATAPAEGEAGPLADWLHATINGLADRRFDEDPLTIGDLAGHEIGEGATRQGAAIAFQMVTTNLSRAQPVLFPNDDAELIFKAEDMERFFPPPVMAYLLRKSGERDRGEPKPRAGRPSAGDGPDREAPAHEVVALPAGFHYLPTAGDLPVVVATRLSLSFPVLLSALRLYSIKGSAFAAARAHHRARPQQRFQLDARRDLDESWFSDGGIAANFPMGIFDAWVPSRPTFGIDLQDAPTADRVPRPAKHEDVVLPRPSQRDTTLSRPAPIAGLLPLLLAMLDTARSARDNAQAAMASYRERVATVYLAADEGGLNLAMSRDALQHIVDKGKDAGGRFNELFSADEHLWVRTLLLMSHLEQELGTLMHAHGDETGSLDPLRNQYLALGQKQVGLKGDARFYRSRDVDWCVEAAGRVDRFFVFIEEWHRAQARWVAQHPEKSAGQFFQVDPPLPGGALRVTSPL